MTDSVFHELRAAILRGDFPAGAELNQVALALRLGVSRGPVREALRRLEAQGLVQQETFRRAVVADLSLRAIGDLYDMRIALEALALKRSLAAGGPPLKALEALVARMDGESDHRRWLSLNARLHQTIYRPCGNRYLLDEIEHLRLNTERFLLHQGTAVFRHESANQQHKDLLRSIRAGDVTQASELLADHLSATLAALVGRLSDDAGGAAEAAQG